MKKQFRRVASFVVLLTLVTIVSLNLGDSTAYSVTWTDSDYFAGMGACDSGYNNALDACHSNPGYPTNPDEAQCRYEAASAYGNCLNGLQPPPMQLDFCSMARGQRDACANIYGVYAQYVDLPAYGECYDASGVSACE